MWAKLFVFYQQQNLGRILGVSCMHLSPPPLACYCKCSVARPHGAVGLSAVCGCGIP